MTTFLYLYTNLGQSNLLSYGVSIPIIQGPKSLAIRHAILVFQDEGSEPLHFSLLPPAL